MSKKEVKSASVFVSKWLNNSFLPLYITIIAASFILQFAAYYYEFPLLRHIGVGTALLTVILYFAQFNAQNLHAYLYGNKDVSHVPEKQIKRQNRLFMRMYLMIGAGLMFLVSLLPEHGILYGIWRFIIVNLSKAIKWLIGEEIPVEEEIVAEEEHTATGIAQLMGVSEDAEQTKTFWEIIIQVLAVLILIALIIYGILDIRRKIKEREKPEFLEEREFIEPDSEYEFVTREFLKKSSITDFTLNAKVRRYYKKRIKHGLHAKEVAGRRILAKENKLKKKEEKKITAVDPESAVFMASSYSERTSRIENSSLGKQSETFLIQQSEADFLSHLTPRELEEYADITKNKDVKRLHEIYEKARYSNQEITRDEFNHL